MVGTFVSIIVSIEKMVAKPDVDHADEVQLVKRAASMSLSIGALWQPIAMSWIEKWKIYVNFDGDQPEPRDPEVRFAQN